MIYLINKHPLYRITICLCLILFSSCIFEPFELFKNSVDKNSVNTEFSDVELNLNQDTIWVYGNQNIRYNFTSSNSNQVILGLKLYIDGVLRDSTSSTNGEFNIVKPPLTEGIHKLNIILYVKSGTGSIADRLNSEVIILTKEWVLVADNSNKKASYTIENGYLKIQWDKYKNQNIKRYIINNYKYSTSNAFSDSTFYGEGRIYNIVVEKLNGEMIPWCTYQVNAILPKPTLKMSPDYKFFIVWNKSPFYNTAKYRLQFTNSETYMSSTTDMNVNDTICSVDLYFYDQFYLNLILMNKNSNEDFTCPRSHLSGNAGEPTKLKNYISFTSTDTISAFDDEYAYKCRINGTTIDSTKIMEGYSFGLAHLQFSSRGSFILGKTYDQTSSGMKFIAKNIMNGKTIISSFIDFNYLPMDRKSIMRISDNGIAIFQTKTKEFMYDFISNTEIASRMITQEELNLNSSIPGSNYYPMIAPDGKHYITSIYNTSGKLALLNVYKRNSNNLELMYSLNNSSTFWEFNKTDPNKIISIIGKTLSIIQCEPYLVVNTYSFAYDEVFMNIDYFNNEILTVRSNQFIIRNFSTGTIIKTVPRQSISPVYYMSYTLHNHKIIRNQAMLNLN